MCKLTYLKTELRLGFIIRLVDWKLLKSLVGFVYFTNLPTFSLLL